MTLEARGRGRLLKTIQNGDYLLAVGLFTIVVVLILPIPKSALDALLAISIGLAVLTLMVIIYVREPTRLSVFPSLLLIATLYRLALNVASTRLILLDADAGKVIQAFGEFVVGGNYVVGGVVFLILVIVNFIVITKGSGRIAEVAARFTLDAMPGKQMAIDAELNAGIIDERTAQERRKKIQQEADFYGKMDGASKFVRGDAVAGILITLINVIAGLAIGMLQRGMTLGDSARLYTLLSIGDGLVSQIPALILSLAAGLLVTRASESQNLGSSLARQLGFYPRAVSILGAVMLVFAILPGMPKIPFVLIGSAALGLGWLLSKAKLDASKFPEILEEAQGDALPSPQTQGALPGMAGSAEATAVGREGAPVKAGREKTSEDMHKLVSVETIAVELGYSLLRLADEEKSGDLIERITGLRRSFAREMGLVLPTVSVRDNFELEANDYRFLLRGKVVAKGRVLPNRSLAMNVSGSEVKIPGEKTKEPVFGLDAVWVDDSGRKLAEINGFTVVDAVSVLCTHLSEIFRTYAHEILDRAAVQKLIDHVKQENPALVDELFPDLITPGILQGVLRGLLKEGITIRNLSLIFEAVADMAPHTKNVNDLTEFARRRLAPYVMDAYESSPGFIKAMTLEPQLEQFLLSRVQKSQFEVGLSLDPASAQHILGHLTRLMSEMVGEGHTPVIVVMQEMRLAFKRFFEPTLPRLVVIAYQEIPPSLEIENFGMIPHPRHLNQKAEKGETVAA